MTRGAATTAASVAAAAAALLLAACRPDLGPGDALVTSVQVLAVRAEPPEARPGAAADYTALVVDPAGTEASPPLLWRWCTAPKPLADNDVVSTECLASASLVAAGGGPQVTATSPKDGCALFGPDTPPGGFRPRDPDATGGYYQPLRADRDGAPPTFALVRILCGLADAPADVAAAYGQQYVPNRNPHLLPLVATASGSEVALDAIPPDARVELQVGWPDGDAETYLAFDPAAQALVSRREAMTVSWHASAGVLDIESTGRAEDDPATTTDVGWSAPPGGVAHLWVVLRDSRGGADFAAYDLTVAR